MTTWSQVLTKKTTCVFLIVWFSTAFLCDVVSDAAMKEYLLISRSSNWMTDLEMREIGISWSLMGNVSNYGNKHTTLIAYSSNHIAYEILKLSNQIQGRYVPVISIYIHLLLDKFLDKTHCFCINNIRWSNKWRYYK